MSSATCYNIDCPAIRNGIAICYDCPEWERCSKFDGKKPRIDEPFSIGKESDPVNHPSHYQGDHECIDIMEAMFGPYELMIFCKLNVYKYRFRAGKKDGSSLEDDLKKATWYENKYMDLLRLYKEKYEK